MDLFQKRFLQSQPNYEIPPPFQPFAIAITEDDRDPHSVWLEFLFASRLPLPGRDYHPKEEHVDFELSSTVVIESLPTLILTETEEEEEEEEDNGAFFCSVCMDEITVGEEAKELLCRHLFHGVCIAPWLKIKNTCPLCRYQLPKPN